MIEREAQQGGIAGTTKHLRLRKARSRPVPKRLDEWRAKVTPFFEPKSEMGEALRYMKNQWTRWGSDSDGRNVGISRELKG